MIYVYMVVVAMDYGEVLERALPLVFRVPDDSFNIASAVRAAATEYYRLKSRKETDRPANFNWGSFYAEIPSEICAKYGFELIKELPEYSLEEVDYYENLVEDEGEVCHEIYTYYSLRRPFGPGTIPEGVVIKEIQNFDNRTFIPEINREAWGLMKCATALPMKVLRDYELMVMTDNVSE